MGTMRPLVVIPTYNESENIERILKRIRECLPEAGILVVDDGSPDGAWPLIEKIAGDDRRVKGLKLRRNFGQHPAIAAGFSQTTGDVIVLMDGDLQDQPEDIPKLLDALTENVDIVYTVKE